MTEEKCRMNRRCSQVLSSDRNYISFAKCYMTLGVLRESFASEMFWLSSCSDVDSSALAEYRSTASSFLRAQSEELRDRCEEGTSAYCIWDAHNPTVIVGQEEIEIAPTTRILPDHQILPPHRNCPLSPVPDILTAKTVCLSSILTPDCGARDA